MTLQEHLNYSRTCSEVAINLKGRMGVEEIVIDSALVRLYVITGRVPQGIVQDDVGVVAVQCTGPQDTFHPMLQPVALSPRRRSELTAAGK